jgi:hypothetical protein
MSPPPPESSRLGFRLLGLVLLAGLLAALIAIVRPSPTPPPDTQTDPGRECRGKSAANLHSD